MKSCPNCTFTKFVWRAEDPSDENTIKDFFLTDCPAHGGKTVLITESDGLNAETCEHWKAKVTKI